MWHVQNIRPWWSAGIRYNLISSDGRYSTQKSKTYNFSVFSTYEKERTILSFFRIKTMAISMEDGGIKERGYVTDSTDQKAENMPIWLNGNEARNSYRNTNFNLQAQYNIGKEKEVINGADTSYTYPARLFSISEPRETNTGIKKNPLTMNSFPTHT